MVRLCPLLTSCFGFSTSTTPLQRPQAFLVRVESVTETEARQPVLLIFFKPPNILIYLSVWIFPWKLLASTQFIFLCHIMPYLKSIFILSCYLMSNHVMEKKCLFTHYLFYFVYTLLEVFLQLYIMMTVTQYSKFFVETEQYFYIISFIYIYISFGRPADLTVNYVE